jgi:rhodanese-related sulfurtransferase
LKLQQKGVVLVDIRVPAEFEREHITGALNVPLFQDVKGSGVFDNVKKFVMATAFAMRATGAVMLCNSFGWSLA